jgi:hypothetical protein
MEKTEDSSHISPTQELTNRLALPDSRIPPLGIHLHAHDHPARTTN